MFPDESQASPSGWSRSLEEEAKVLFSPLGCHLADRVVVGLADVEVASVVDAQANGTVNPRRCFFCPFFGVTSTTSLAPVLAT